MDPQVSSASSSTSSSKRQASVEQALPSQPMLKRQKRDELPEEGVQGLDSKGKRKAGDGDELMDDIPSSAKGSPLSPTSSIPTITSSSGQGTPSRLDSAPMDDDTSLPGPTSSQSATWKPLGESAESRPTDAERELARLKQELATKDELLHQNQTTFGALQGILTCQICLELMWNPYITACGHTACVKCFQDWFRSPAAGGPNDDGHVPLAPQLRRKTCPTCRAVTRARPTPLFIIKSILGTVSSSLDPEVVGASAPRGVEIVPGGEPVDPWRGIFPKDDYLARGDGILADDEDGVVRCQDCLYEIFNGICQGCGRVFHDHIDTDSDGDGEPEHDFPAWIFHEGIQAPSDEDEDSEDDGSDVSEDSYGGSFIDDGEYVGHPGPPLRRIVRPGPVADDDMPPLIDASGSDSEDDVDYHPPVNAGRAARRAIVISDSEEDVDAQIRRRTRRMHVMGQRIDRMAEEIAAREREQEMYGEDDFIDRSSNVARPSSSSHSDSESDSASARYFGLSPLSVPNRAVPPRARARAGDISLSDSSEDGHLSPTSRLRRHLSEPVRVAATISVSSDSSSEEEDEVEVDISVGNPRRRRARPPANRIDSGSESEEDDSSESPAVELVPGNNQDAGDDGDDEDDERASTQAVARSLASRRAESSDLSSPDEDGTEESS